MATSLANLVVAVHVGFVAFVVLGGLLVLRWPRVAWVHVPCVGWGILVELAGWICPLTPLEQVLRRSAGQGGYGTSFVEHYVLPLLYPTALIREIQVGLGLGVLVLNLFVYGWVLRRRAALHG